MLKTLENYVRKRKLYFCSIAFELIKRKKETEGKHVVIVGRSLIVGYAFEKGINGNSAMAFCTQKPQIYLSYKQADIEIAAIEDLICKARDG